MSIQMRKLALLLLIAGSPSLFAADDLTGDNIEAWTVRCRR